MAPLATYFRDPARLMRRRAWKRLVETYPPRKLTIETWNGRLSFLSSDRLIGKALYVDRAYERPWIEGAHRWLERLQLRSPQRDVLIDIGAHLGMVCCAMLRHHMFRTAIAVEPTPRTFALLQKNLKQNCLADRTHTFNVGLSDHAGTLHLGESADNSGANWVLSDADAERTDITRLTVPCLTLEELLAEHLPEHRERIGLVWMDVEGHESSVLQGAEFIRQERVPVVAEFHPGAIAKLGPGIGGYLRVVERFFTHFVPLGERVAGPQPVSDLRDLFFERQGQRHDINLLFLHRA